jgi:hypothetical protein
LLLGFDSVAAVCVVFGVSRITSGLFLSWKFFTDAGGTGDVVQTSYGNDFSVAKKMGKHLVFVRCWHNRRYRRRGYMEIDLYVHTPIEISQR